MELIEHWIGLFHDERRRPRTPVHPTNGFQHGRPHGVGTMTDAAKRKQIQKRRAKKGYR